MNMAKRGKLISDSIRHANGLVSVWFLTLLSAG